MYTIGQPCIYVPNGSPCEILRLYAERHRAAITITESGREIDEVAWHDLVARVVVELVPKATLPEEAPEPEGEATEEPSVFTQVTDPLRAAAAEETYRRRTRGESGR